MMRLYKSYLYALFITVVAAGCNKSGPTYVPPEYVPPKQTTFQNPLLPSGPDPWVIKKDSFYYYTHTDGDKIRLWKTKAMSELGSAPVVTVFNKPSSGPNSEHVWAPELHFFDNKWYMYYTAGATADQGNQRLFVLENTSADPTKGTWTDKGKVSDPTADLWAIDATVFEQNGNKYILWSGYSSALDFTQRIYIAKLQNPWTITGARSVISSPQYPWESIGAPPPVNEGPEILINNAGKPILIFSASGCWTDDYSLGMSLLKDGGNPLVPSDWIKSSNPVFVKNPENGAYGPGHCAFFKSPDGTEDWLLYHANSSANQQCSPTRNPRIQKFTWNTDGTPNFGTPVKIGADITKPSGEK